MSYQVLARRYRSTDFDEVIGQSPIARTLRNAIARNRTAHAYLFTGTRGVGKTSMARIFAKALNTSDELLEKDNIAVSILQGNDIDVIEIDAASNRGVDNARDLIANSSMSPARCPFKIYIIDEVHMLTNASFNTLLKTMEEPPAHVKFILCTTEPHRVPATIQSRCQRFDFRNISAARIADHLNAVLEQEGEQADQRVVGQIARMANGSMRDGLSLLDRLLAAADGQLTPELLEQMLGLPDQTLLVQLVDALADSNAAVALRCSTELLEKGLSIEQTLEALIEHLRHMMLIAACGPDDELIDLTGEDRQTLADQAARFDTQSLVHMIALCEAVSRNIRGSSTARALFDAAIVRLAMTEHLASISALLQEQSSTDNKETRTRKKKEPVSTTPNPPAPETSRADTQPKTPAPEPKAAPPEPAPPLDDAQLWSQVQRHVARSHADQPVAEAFEFVSFDSNVLTLRANPENESIATFLMRNPRKLIELIRKATGRTVELAFQTPEKTQTQPATDSGEDLEDAQTHPAVRDAMEIFDAIVTSVSPNTTTTKKNAPRRATKDHGENKENN